MPCFGILMNGSSCKMTPLSSFPRSKEMLRYESPVARQPRLMKQDARNGGKRLQQGEMVFQMLNAG